MRNLLPVFALLPLLAATAHAEVTVATLAELRAALQAAKPGDTVKLAPGTYTGGTHLHNIRGTAEKPVVLDGGNALLNGGTVGLQLSDCNYLTLRNLTIAGQTDNGLNIDDANTYDSPSIGIVLDNLTVHDIGPAGNHDGIKLSGLEKFTIRNCRIEGWGGSAIDMVGCHDGLIEDNTFTGKPGFTQDSGIQNKGGTARILIRRNRFDNAGSRAVNAGGSTGLAYFRPQDAPYEAQAITIERNHFTGSDTPVAFVGLDGGAFRYNTVVNPRKWLWRALQETRGPRFVACRDVKIEHNAFTFTGLTPATAVNIGPATTPETFLVRHNLFYRNDDPTRSMPTTPGTYQDNIEGEDPTTANASQTFGHKATTRPN